MKILISGALGFMGREVAAQAARFLREGRFGRG